MGNQIKSTSSFPFCTCGSSTIVDGMDKSITNAPIQPGNNYDQSQRDFDVFLDSSKPVENGNNQTMQPNSIEDEKFQEEMNLLRLPSVVQAKGIFQSAYISKIVERNDQNYNQDQELQDQEQQHAEVLRQEEEEEIRKKAIESQIKRKQQEEEQKLLQIERENELKHLKEKEEYLQKIKTQELELQSIRQQELDIQKKISQAAAESNRQQEREEKERQARLQEQLKEQQRIQDLEKKILQEKELASKNMLKNLVKTLEFMYNGPYYYYKDQVTPHGEGKILYPGRNYTINGKFNHGKLMEIIQICFGDKSTYEGETLNEVPHGKGVHKAADDSWSYSGMFENGLKHGKGIMKLQDKIFEGEFHENKATGKFKVTSGVNGDVYEGDIVDMQRHGEGVLRNSHGKILCEGTFIDGVFQKQKK